MLDQVLLFRLDEFLAVGLAWISLLRRDVRELLERAGIDRHEVQIVFARERHGRLVACPTRICFRTGRPRDVAARACDAVDQHDVSVVHEQHTAVCRVPDAADRRRAAALGVGEFPRVAALPANHPGGGFRVIRPAPFEVQPLRVARPAKACRRIADELGPSHDAVDRQLEPLGRRRRFLGGSAGDGDRGDDEAEGRDAARDTSWNVHGGNPVESGCLPDR